MIKFIYMKKLLISFIITFTLNLSTFALDENNNKTKILLEEAMNLAIIGNIELQEQRKNLDISQNKIAISNGLKNPQFQQNYNCFLIYYQKIKIYKIFEVLPR